MKNEEIKKVLKGCIDAISLAFEYEGDVFGYRHNSVCDAVNAAEQLLKELDNTTTA